MHRISHTLMHMLCPLLPPSPSPWRRRLWSTIWTRRTCVSGGWLCAGSWNARWLECKRPTRIRRPSWCTSVRRIRSSKPTIRSSYPTLFAQCYFD
ncbi:hypothetical protein C8Q70DRAFT_244637 [Cubamyces menziesii]|nr:hypothetical protein C8Q70DRAFT_244637 [Cubamyces menziesii]